MQSSFPHRVLPIAYFVDKQIAYVTDNDRDAEALSCRVEGTVVVNRGESPRSPARQPAVSKPTFQTPQRSGRSNVRNASRTRDVSDASESETLQYIPNTSEVPDISDVSSVSTLDL